MPDGLSLAWIGRMMTITVQRVQRKLMHLLTSPALRRIMRHSRAKAHRMMAYGLLVNRRTQ